MKKQKFSIYCSFDLTYTFPGKELVQDPDGHEGDMEPRCRAIEKLEAELADCLRIKFPGAGDVRCFTDSEYALK